MRILFVLAALPLLATFSPPALLRDPPGPGRTILTFEPLALDPENPGRRTLGRLLYLGGWAVRSTDSRFGGISAIHVENGRAIAISDAGSLIRFALPTAGRTQAIIQALPDGPGSPARKRDRDAEAMVVHREWAWIAFEARNAVWRYKRSDWRSDAHLAPPAMRKWPGGAGSEAILRLADGRFLIFSEGRKRADGSTEVLLFSGDPALARTRAVSLGYRAPDGYSITDAALLGDGRLLFLNRRFTLMDGVSAKLTIGAAGGLGEGAILGGEEIAHFRPPILVDNFEALSAGRERGRTILWIASDDNFSALQRTLLLKFALAE